MLLDLSVATLGAPASAIDIDVAELLVACTVLVGPDRALEGGSSRLGPDGVKGAIPFLERAALTPHVRDLAHDHEVELKELREGGGRSDAREGAGARAPAPRAAARLPLRQGARRAGGLPPDQRSSRRSGSGRSPTSCARPSLAWVVRRVHPRAADLHRRRRSPCAARCRRRSRCFRASSLQSAIKFINLTVPSSAGRIGIRRSFPPAAGRCRDRKAVAAGAIDDTSRHDRPGRAHRDRAPVRPPDA